MIVMLVSGYRKSFLSLFSTVKQSLGGWDSKPHFDITFCNVLVKQFVACTHKLTLGMYSFGINEIHLDSRICCCKTIRSSHCMFLALDITFFLVLFLVIFFFLMMTLSAGISYKEHQVQTPGSSGTNPKHDGENMFTFFI